MVKRMGPWEQGVQGGRVPCVPSGDDGERLEGTCRADREGEGRGSEGTKEKHRIYRIFKITVRVTFS